MEHQAQMTEKVGYAQQVSLIAPNLNMFTKLFNKPSGVNG